MDKTKIYLRVEKAQDKLEAARQSLYKILRESYPIDSILAVKIGKRRWLVIVRDWINDSFIGSNIQSGSERVYSYLNIERIEKLPCERGK